MTTRKLSFDVKATGRVLGRGGFGIVDLVQDRKTSQFLARKRVNLDGLDSAMRKMLLREAEILEELSQFDGFVKLVGKEEDPFANTITLYMEYCESGSLDGYIKDHLARNYQVAPREILLFAAQMLSALDRLHRPVVHAGGKLLFQGAALLHRDIKPANIMILGKAFKLGDVGIARTLEEGSPAGTRIGTAPKMRSLGPGLGSALRINSGGVLQAESVLFEIENSPKVSSASGGALRRRRAESAKPQPRVNAGTSLLLAFRLRLPLDSTQSIDASSG
ncbi:hypothetical protein CF336_g841 [Tilletia laevis]|nr:hypothetical protein CF335_g5964 [Tilletia laevis]KAE8200159.1 hypothetical protein CF336_g841 [Tilletia laevis]